MTDRNDPLELMDEIGELLVDCDGDEYRDVNESDWQSLRTTLEAQCDKLAQKDARIARLEDELRRVNETMQSLRACDVLNESPRQSAATIKAEALLEFADAEGDGWPDDAYEHGFQAAVEKARKRADRIEREAKEASDG